MARHGRPVPHVTPGSTGAGTGRRRRSRRPPARPSGPGSARPRAARRARGQDRPEHPVHRAAQRQRLGDGRVARLPGGAVPEALPLRVAVGAGQVAGVERAGQGLQGAEHPGLARGRGPVHPARAGPRELLLERGQHLVARVGERARRLRHGLHPGRHQLLQPLLRRRRRSAALGQPADELVELEAAVAARRADVRHPARGGPCAQRRGADPEQSRGRRHGQQPRSGLRDGRGGPLVEARAPAVRHLRRSIRIGSRRCSERLTRGCS